MDDLYTMYDMLNSRGWHYISKTLQSAARAGRLDVLQYLANQGLGPSEIE
jgi:hypothetical protein